MPDPDERPRCLLTAAEANIADYGDLFSRQPLCQAMCDVGGHFIFVCKPASHPLIQEYLRGAERGLLERTVKSGKQRLIHRYRWLPDLPLRDGRDAMTVNWFGIEIIRSDKG